MRGQGQIDDVNGAVGLAFDLDQPAAVRFQIGGIGFQLIGGDLEHDLARFRGRFDDRVAHAVRGAAGEGAHAVRAGVGVGRVDQHVLKGNAQMSRRRSGR